jgi:hypothetical protein
MKKLRLELRTSRRLEMGASTCIQVGKLEQVQCSAVQSMGTTQPIYIS